jgi:hypothetical protein
MLAQVYLIAWLFRFDRRAANASSHRPTCPIERAESKSPLGRDVITGSTTAIGWSWTTRFKDCALETE